MSKDNAKKGEDKRTPAQELILDFLRLHKITLVIDRVNLVEENVKDLVYSVNEKMRVRAIYNDQIKKEPKPENGDSEKVEVVT